MPGNGRLFQQLELARQSAGGYNIIMNAENTKTSLDSTYVTNPPLEELTLYLTGNPQLNLVRYSDYFASVMSDPLWDQAERTRVLEKIATQSGNHMKILKVPAAFYGFKKVLESAVLDEQRLHKLRGYATLLKDRLVQYSAQGVELPADLVKAISALPMVLTMIPDTYEIPLSLFPTLNVNPAYIYLEMSNATDDAATRTLWTVLCGYPEYVRHTLRVQLEGAYFTGLTVDLKNSFACPHWALQCLKGYGPAEYQSLLRYITEYKETNPWCAHCYYWMSTRAATREEKKAEVVKILKVLTLDPYVALMIATEHQDLKNEEPAVGLLTYSVQDSPLWSYNWARWIGAPNARMLKTLMDCVPWAIQYIDDCKPKDSKQLLEQLLKKHHNEYWSEWLYAYIREWENANKITLNP